MCGFLFLVYSPLVSTSIKNISGCVSLCLLLSLDVDEKTWEGVQGSEVPMSYLIFGGRDVAGWV